MLKVVKKVQSSDQSEIMFRKLNIFMKTINTILISDFHDNLFLLLYLYLAVSNIREYPGYTPQHPSIQVKIILEVHYIQRKKVKNLVSENYASCVRTLGQGVNKSLFISPSPTAATIGNPGFLLRFQPKKIHAVTLKSFLNVFGYVKIKMM